MPYDYSINMMPWMSSGAYGTYDNYMPSSMMGMSGMNGMGGMYSPYGSGYMNMMMEYQLMMQKMKEEAEKAEANHTANMHSIMTDNEVKAHKERFDANFAKSSHDGEIQGGIDNLYRKIMEGDQRGVCDEFDKLVEIVYKTYSDEFKKNSNGISSPRAMARNIIEKQYAAQISYEYGGQHDLENDIAEHCENEFLNGFNQSLRGGHNDMTAAEVRDHIFGTRIDNEKHRKHVENFGKLAGNCARVGKGALIGAGAGTAAYLLTSGVGTALGKGLMNEHSNVISRGANATGEKIAALCKFKGGNLGRVALLSGLALAVGDIIWGWAN